MFRELQTFHRKVFQDGDEFVSDSGSICPDFSDSSDQASAELKRQHHQQCIDSGLDQYVPGENNIRKVKSSFGFP